MGLAARRMCLIILWIYISLKRRADHGVAATSLIILWIYISLKRRADHGVAATSLIILWIYISLKQSFSSFRRPGQFDYPLNLHISQTPERIDWIEEAFDYPLNLHISQTEDRCPMAKASFDYPLNLHISQTPEPTKDQVKSLIILWIYISLKHGGWRSTDREGLIILWIYISLKHSPTQQGPLCVWLSFEFTYLSNLKFDQRIIIPCR